MQPGICQKRPQATTGKPSSCLLAAPPGVCAAAFLFAAAWQESWLGGATVILTHTHTYVYTHTCQCTGIHTHTGTYMYTVKHILLHTYTHIYVQTRHTVHAADDIMTPVHTLIYKHICFEHKEISAKSWYESESLQSLRLRRLARANGLLPLRFKLLKAETTLGWLHDSVSE